MKHDAPLRITVPMGIAPLIVTSQTLVENLNARFLNGYGPSAFAWASHTHPASQISNATSAGISLLTAADAEEQRRSLEISDLSGTPTVDIEAVAYHRTRVNSGGATSTRRRLNVIAGDNITLSIADDPTDDETDVTISSNLNDRLVATQHSLTGGGDLSANRTLSLVNDEESPGNSEYYGTNSGGTKGYHPLPTPSGGNVRNVRKVTGTYSATTSDSVILADAPSSGNYTVTLPFSGVSDGQMFTVARTTDAYSGTGVIVDFGFSTEGLDVSEDSRTYIWHSSSGRYYRLDGPNS